MELRPLARQAHELVDVVDQLRVDADLAVLPRRSRGSPRATVTVSSSSSRWSRSTCTLCIVRISASSVGRRIVDDQLEHEAVQLGLGQVVGALGLDRVLRGQHQERPLDLVAGPLDRDAVLLHDLQQGRVRLGRRAVDLVGQQQLGEDRARAESETPGSSCRRSASPVMSDGIRSAVNWMRPNWQPSTRPSVRTNSVLPKPGHALDQHVPAGEQGHQRAQHQFVLADEDLADLGRDAVEELAAWAVFGPLGSLAGRLDGFGRGRVGGIGMVRFNGDWASGSRSVRRSNERRSGLSMDTRTASRVNGAPCSGIATAGGNSAEVGVGKYFRIPYGLAQVATVNRVFACSRLPFVLSGRSSIALAVVDDSFS